MALLLAEGLLRLAPADSRLGIESAPRAPAPPEVLALLSWDRKEEVRFSLAPGAQSRFMGTDVRTNSLGFRGPELTPGGFRLVGLGDSVMFGWGVQEEECYLHLVAEGLEDRVGPVTAANLGVPGYNALQQLALFERHIDRLEPDFVIVGFVNNDFLQPGFYPEWAFLERNSHLYRLLQLRWQGTVGLRTRRHRARIARSFDRFRWLAAQGRQRGFEVLVFVYGGFGGPKAGKGPRYAEFRELCRELGMTVVEFEGLVARAVAAGEIEDHSDLWLRPHAPVDVHPNPRGHALAAAGILEAMRSRPPR